MFTVSADSVLKTIEPNNAENVDLRNIRIPKKVGGALDECGMIGRLPLQQQVVKSGGGLIRVEEARMALDQFQLSPPKQDMEESPG